MTYNYDIKAAFNLDQIELITEFRAGDKVLDIQRRVFELHEQTIKDALVKLGWTPPLEKCDGTPQGASTYSRLRQYLDKATFAHGADRHAALVALAEMEASLASSFERAKRVALDQMSRNDVLKEQLATLRTTASAFLEKYRDLVACGDCGHWDPDQEPEVIALVAALEAAQ